MVSNKKPPNKIPPKPVSGQIPPILLWMYALSAIAIIPVVYNTLVIDVTLMPRFVVTTVLLLFYFVFFLVQPRYNLPDTQLLNRWAVLFWIMFIGISIISLIVAINPTEGLFDIFKISVALFYIILTTSILINTGNLKPFIIAAALVAAIYLSVGFYQYFTYAFRHSDINSLYKVIGIWTHKNVFSSGFFLLVPLIMYGIFTTKTLLQIIYTVLLFLVLTLMFLLQTRSVWVALIVDLLVSSLLFFYFRRGILTQSFKSKIFKGFIHIGCSVVLSLLLSWFITDYSINNPLHHVRGVKSVKSSKSSELHDIEKRAASIFNEQDANRNQRIDIWRMTSKMILEHPVIGVGAGNWKILIPSYFEKGYNQYWYNNWRNPHNDFIWALAEKGILGLIAFIGFFVFLLLYTLKLLAKDIDPKLKIFIILAISGIAGYSADSSFSFPFERIELLTLMLFYASAIIWLYSVNFPLKDGMKKLKVKLFTVIAILFLIVAFICGRIWVKEEVYTQMAFTALGQGDWQSVTKLIDEASTSIDQLDPRSSSILWFRGKANLELNKPDEALEDLEKAMDQNPNSIMVLTDLGVVYARQGKHQQAIEMFQKALKIYPDYKDALFNLGLSYYVIGRYYDALNSLSKCKSNVENKQLNDQIELVKAKLEEERLRGEETKKP
jgi:putative inorganic carbon (hco3(-)) transporter